MSGNILGGDFLGGNFPVGNFPRTVFSSKNWETFFQALPFKFGGAIFQELIFSHYPSPFCLSAI